MVNTKIGYKLYNNIYFNLNMYYLFVREEEDMWGTGRPNSWEFCDLMVYKYMFFRTYKNFTAGLTFYLK